MALTLLRPLVAASLFLSVALSSVQTRAAGPTPAECLSSNESSIKLRKEHRFRESREQLLVCAALACPSEVRSECERRIVEVNGLVPTIIFEPKDAAGSDLPGVTVHVDDQTTPIKLEGTPIALDPGAHMFHFRSAAGDAVERTLIIQEGEKGRREVVPFGKAAEHVGPALGRPLSPTIADSLADRSSAATSRGNGQRLAGWVVGASGVVGFAIGSVFGALALADASQQKNACAPSGCAEPNHSQAANDHNNAVSAGTVSTVGFIAGGVLLVGGVTLLLTAPKKSAGETSTALTLTTALTRDGGSLVLEGRF